MQAPADAFGNLLGVNAVEGFLDDFPDDFHRLGRRSLRAILQALKLALQLVDLIPRLPST